MNLTGKNIRHVNTITHDGKVLVFGTAADGTIYYSIKRSGFEDSAVQEGVDPFGFEDWERLRVGESEPDDSVTAIEQETLADTNGNQLVRSVFGSGPDVTVSADAPVQLISALDHLYVFRQAMNGKILMSRFVLDGMTNELLPRLEVRFRRSKQRFEPQKTTASKNGDNFDNLDYRDIDGKSFFEPSVELSFLGNVSNGWFVPLFVPTTESDRNRWHFFVYDTTGKIVLYTTGADDKGNVDVKDYLLAYPDPSAPDNTIYRSIPGIIRRNLDLQGLTVVGGPTATTYDIQKEIMTDAGPQLMRDVVRVMLAVPVTATGSTVVKTAVVDFALASDGTLSRIDQTPDTSVVLRSNVYEVITPVSLFDDIKEFAASSPPPTGTVVATERGEEDQLQIRSNAALAPTLEPGSKVKIRGTKSYDGHYKVISVNGTTFQVAASFQNNEAGVWELVPEKETGLVFDNMIVGTEKTPDGKLMISCPAHDLKVGDEVQIAGTREYNGIFPITSIDAAAKSFVLDTPYFTGEAANLTKVIRRGLRMGGGEDRVETPELELVPPSPQRNFGRTLSAWVRVDAAGNVEQSLIRDDGQLMNLAVGSDNKVKLVVRMSDGATRTVTDPEVIPIGTWTHYSGSVDYLTTTAGDTRISLSRNGVDVSRQIVKRQLPCHLDDRLMTFDGTNSIEVANAATMFARDFTVAFWAKVTGGSGTQRTPITCQSPAKGVAIFAEASNRWLFCVADGGQFRIVNGPPIIDGEWVHLAGTFRGTTMSLYVNGVLQGTMQCSYAAPAITAPMRIGAFTPGGGTANKSFWGQIAGVEVW
ncbi:MAG TPA: hypothetical protein PKA58_13680, partial [Polyangium sp.]|nr:hypothetical protein [Polyangium sp.]